MSWLTEVSQSRQPSRQKQRTGISTLQPQRRRRANSGLRYPLLVFSLGLILQASAVAQSSLSALVRDSADGRPIQGAEIVFDTGLRSIVSDASGRAVISGLSPGKYVLTVRAIGFRPLRIAVEIGEATVVTREFRLVSEAAVLDSIVVRERAPTRGSGVGVEGFEDRKRLGFGRFIDSTTLRANEHRDLATVLSLAGVEVRNGVALGRGPYGRPCPMTVYLDGSPLGGDPFLRRYTIFSLQAVEAYRSNAQIPAHFRRLNQPCGVLLLWTRK